MKVLSGSFNLIVILSADVACTESTFCQFGPNSEATFGSPVRFSDQTTSSAVSGLPSQNLTPWRSVTTMLFGFGCSQETASFGSSFPWGLVATNGSGSSLQTTQEYPSKAWLKSRRSEERRVGEEGR